MKANNKTRPSKVSVDAYMAAIEGDDRKRDAEQFLQLLSRVTKAEPIMWGSSIVGVGNHHYSYDSGREGDIATIGFSARKQALAVYGIRTDKNAALLEQMGLAQESKGCVYIKNVDQIDKSLLSQVITNAYNERNNA